MPRHSHLLSMKSWLSGICREDAHKTVALGRADVVGAMQVCNAGRKDNTICRVPACKDQ